MTKTDRDIEELKTAGLFGEDSDYNGMVGNAVKELLVTFQKQGHSGFSAPLVAGIFHRLVEGKTLTPLQGTPDEWGEPFDEDGQVQNRRNGAVFAKNNKGEGAYCIDGRVFVDKHGGAYSCKKSRTPLKFPCYPKTTYHPDWLIGKIKKRLGMKWRNA